MDILEDTGFRSFEAPSVERALSILQEHHASIVLLFTDVELTGSAKGFALAQETARRWPHIGIMVTSGRVKPSPGDMPEGAHFLGTPFSAEAVYTRLRQLLPDGQKPEPLKR
jgi:DNA-binding NtrC family response regulator